MQQKINTHVFDYGERIDVCFEWENDGELYAYAVPFYVSFNPKDVAKSIKDFAEKLENKEFEELRVLYA